MELMVRDIVGTKEPAKETAEEKAARQKNEQNEFDKIMKLVQSFDTAGGEDEPDGLVTWEEFLSAMEKLNSGEEADEVRPVLLPAARLPACPPACLPVCLTICLTAKSARDNRTAAPRQSNGRKTPRPLIAQNPLDLPWQPQRLVVIVVRNMSEREGRAHYFNTRARARVSV